MATRTARRGLGARAILVAISLFAMATMVMPAQAAGLTILDTSVDNGWASLTNRMPGSVACHPNCGAYDPNDPAQLRSNGQVTVIKARFNRTLCTGALESYVEVKDRNGVLVPGVVRTFENYKFFANSIMAASFTAPGLSGALAPYSVTWFARERLTTNPFCAGLTVPFGSGNLDDGLTSVDESGMVFGLDRRLPKVPTVTSPKGTRVKSNNCSPVGDVPIFGEDLAGSPAGALSHDVLDTLGYCALDGSSDQWTVATVAPGAPVVVNGTATDPLTFEDDEYLPRLESSGIGAVHIKLYESLPDGGWVFGTELLADWYIANPDCGSPVDHDEDAGAVSPDLDSCSSSMTFSKDITSELIPGFWYSIRVNALDHAGYLSDDLTAQVRSGDTNSVSFLYLG